MRKLNDAALLERYGLVEGEVLKNLGVLLVGARRARARIGGVVRAARYEKDERAVAQRWEWDDEPLWTLPDAIWREVAALDEREDIPTRSGISRTPAFDERVVRELVVNALVHRSYAQRGDVDVRLYADRLEVESPGRLPPTVTRVTLMRAQRPRNERLVRLFIDLGLMEGTGAGRRCGLRAAAHGGSRSAGVRRAGRQRSRHGPPRGRVPGSSGGSFARPSISRAASS